MNRRTPNLLKNIFTYFWESLQPRKIKGDLKGKDFLGNKYYEIAADPSRGKRRPSRWFENDEGQGGFDHEKPAEWESWLRFRRNEPPTEEEVAKNQAIIALKQKNSALLDEKFGKAKPLPVEKGKDSFPTYEEFSHADKK